MSIADETGRFHSIDAVCVELRISDRIMVDQLDENFGGLVVLAGTGLERLGAGWTIW